MERRKGGRVRNPPLQPSAIRFRSEPLALNLEKLLPVIEDLPGYRELAEKLKSDAGHRSQILAIEAVKPFLIAAIYHDLPFPVLVITARPESAKRLHEQMSLWTTSPDLNIFPEPDLIPYQRAIADFSIEQDRLQVLSLLVNAEKDKRRPLIIASAAALDRKSV